MVERAANPHRQVDFRGDAPSADTNLYLMGQPTFVHHVPGGSQDGADGTGHFLRFRQSVQPTDSHSHSHDHRGPRQFRGSYILLVMLFYYIYIRPN